MLLACRYGPRGDTKGAVEYSASGSLLCDVRYAPFSKPARVERTPAQTAAERSTAAAIVSAVSPAVLLDRYPKAVIEVHVLILLSDGADLSTCIIAAALAVANAGIEMVDLPASVTLVGKADSGATGAPAVRMLVDPTSAEEAAATFKSVLAYMPVTAGLSYSEHAGSVSDAVLLTAVQTGMQACIPVYTEMRNALVAAERRRTRAAHKAAASS
ncbi:hypothetical protein EON62_00525 [archaeon]|nr:MAG: hypothetical protein EON62_00525 [archaeon]